MEAINSYRPPVVKQSWLNITGLAVHWGGRSPAINIIRSDFSGIFL